MPPPLLTLRDIKLTVGGTPLLTGAELNVVLGDRLCLVGRNGSGKSTLLKVASGLVEPDSGEIFVQPGTSIAYLPQDIDFSGYKTTRDYAVSGLGAVDDPHRAQILLEALGLTGREDPADLSGGEGRRAGLACVLAQSPDVLLLDEPTNHLDIAAIEWLEDRLGSLKAAIVTISHDRRFLKNLSRATIWLDRGKTRRLEKGFGAFEAWRDDLLEQEEKAWHKLDRKIAREEQWMHGGVSGRRKRNQRRLAELRAMRQERKDRWRAQGQVQLEASQADVGGKLVVEAVGLSKSFGDLHLVKDFSTRILKGDRVGLVGANGTGKTTLLNLLTGGLQPDHGRIRLGKALELVTLDQKRESLKPGASVADILTGGGSDYIIINDKPRHVVGYMKDFLFQPEQVRSPITVLSGGERARLMLARALAKPSNVLVLDEPTNDLDLDTLELLQEQIADYSGTVLLVSHDRDFLDRIVTSVIVPEGDGRWIEYAGGYTDMLAQRGECEQMGGQSPSKKPSAKKPKVVRPKPQPGERKKLSFKDRHALNVLPQQIESLNAEIASLHETLSEDNLYGRDPDVFVRATERLNAAEAELASAEEQWLQLEILREEIEG